MIVRVKWILLAVFLFAAPVYAAVDTPAVHFRAWLDEFKQTPRGPFEEVQWFCKDGAILPPKAYACVEHGGGIQHGEWNDHAHLIRKNGYLVANLFVLLKPEQFTGADAQLDSWKQILLEQYLIRADDGWIFRHARYYRGAIQAEVEQDSATKIVLAMLADNKWLASDRYLLLRESVRMLPLAVGPLLSVKVRQAATDIAELDKGFHDLRVKIHSMPDGDDAARVRRYASESGRSELQQAYTSLASDLDRLYSPRTTIEQLKNMAGESRNIRFKREIAETIDALRFAAEPARVLTVAASKSQHFHDILVHQNRYTVYNRLRLLRATLILEQEIFAQSNLLLEMINQPTTRPISRATRLAWLKQLGVALYATGLLSDRQWQAMRAELDILRESTVLGVDEYAGGLRYLARIAQWCQRSLEFHFASTVSHWQKLTPLVQHFVPDRLRDSPLLPFTRILDTLVADANRISGITHAVFGQNIATGVRALNPGLSRGRLMLQPSNGEALQPDGIYMMESTRHSLTPVAGIITRGEGSSVSHMQLLARNLGIPNLVVNDSLFQKIKTHLGESVVIAISHHGMVHIESNSSKWDVVFGQEQAIAHDRIQPDLRKLNLRNRMLKPLSAIRARDSGRTVGPKAANLGELSHYFPGKVNPGLVIPFGVFRKHLDQPITEGGPSVFKWMKAEYTRIGAIDAEGDRIRERHLFLSRLRGWIINSDPGANFRHQLRTAMAEWLGADGSYGVFVRSDTNVEDLPGFSGAGLNLTVPNVVGFEAIIQAVMRVWASPFSERAFAWRQSYMDKPEHVYPAVLLMKSFSSEESGVLVTSDVNTGDRSLLSVASNEGVGGAVEGQFAEELRVAQSGQGVKLYAQASAPLRAVLNPQGGVKKVAVSGHQYVLTGHEIAQLRQLVRDVEERFPLPGQGEKQAVADIEFGFRHGQLSLFQIRPFVESKRARQSQTLINMDQRLPDHSGVKIHLDQAPVADGGL